MSHGLKQLLRTARERWIALQTLHYVLVQAAYRLRLRKHQSGAVHSGWTLERTHEYVLRVFEDYLQYGGLTRGDLRDLSVLEIGPGANLGVALLFAAHGARSVVCVDRFESERDDQFNRALYQSIVRSLAGEARLRAQACLDTNELIRSSAIRCSYGMPVEMIHRQFEAGSFDLIVSRAVLEHVYGIEQAWRSMDCVLRPGGRMLHKIDFRCHSFYENAHPLYFLALPQWLWDLVAAPDPTLNRARLATYDALVSKYGYAGDTYLTHLSDRADELIPHIKRPETGYRVTTNQASMIEGIRHRLARPFRTMTQEELIVSGIFLTVTKPGGPGESPSEHLPAAMHLQASNC